MVQETTIENDTGHPVVGAEALDGVRTSRVLAFFIDYLIIGVLCIPFAVVIGLLSILTLGLALGLYVFLVPAVALLYLAFTMGGPNQATVGMRMMGIRIARLDGKQVDPLLACLHGILFWVIHPMTAWLFILVTFFSSKKRLLQDILLGTYVARD